MKKTPHNKYLGTKFQAIPKHLNTFAFSPGNTVTVPAESDKIPAYNSSGLKQYKRILPPLRDPKEIDLLILAEVMTAVVPEFDLNDMRVNNGICEIGKLKFRFSDLKFLLKTLQSEGFLQCDDYIRRSIEYQYNIQFQNKRHEKRHSNT